MIWMLCSKACFSGKINNSVLASFRFKWCFLIQADLSESNGADDIWMTLHTYDN